MSAHVQASAESRELCDQLFAALCQVIPKLRRSSTKGSCGLFEEGRTRFAYIYHSRVQPQIEIWCRGNVEELQRHSRELVVIPRDHQHTGWEESFPARFRVQRADQLSSATALLTEVSYAASTQKS